MNRHIILYYHIIDTHIKHNIILYLYKVQYKNYKRSYTRQHVYYNNN